MLERINTPEDLKGLSDSELQELAYDIRQFLVHSVAKTGGHLSSNLGAVELTIALHAVFNTPLDKIVWDVGHQAYVHKILTGRKDRFDSLRQKDGISGFPKASESEYDAFDVGHASTSISAAFGMARARDLQHENYDVVAVIGDGSLTGGMAYEALNHAGKRESKVIIILNDNDMAISPSVGRLSNNLGKMIRTRKFYLKTKIDLKRLLIRIPGCGYAIYKGLRRFKKRLKYFMLNGVFFEEMGFVYLGPVDGHNIKDLKKVLNQAKNLEDPVIVHVKTIKGKGYEHAEKDPSRFHGVSPFDTETGEMASGAQTWSSVFGKTLLKIAEKDPRVCAITAAMPSGTGLTEFAKAYPERCIDVGIAEEHAVTFAAGMAKAGMRPVVAVYSTFLQRSYDQMLHDVCITGLPVLFALDRSGIVGEDGETHQGIYDLSYMTSIPGMTVMSPASANELVRMMQKALEWNRPCAIRYPRGTAIAEVEGNENADIEYGKSLVLHKGSGTIAVLAIGDCVEMAVSAQKQLAKEGLDITVVNARFAAPLDLDVLDTLQKDHERIITVEDNIDSGGFGMHVAAYVTECIVQRISIPDQYVRQGKRDALLDQFNISTRGIIETIHKGMKNNG